MSYQYRAKDKSGAPLQGVVDAASTAEARQKLRKQGLFILDVAPATKAQAQSLGGTGGGRIRKTDILALMSQMTIMNQSGVDLADSLKNAAEQCPNKSLRSVLQVVHADVSAGLSFSAALRRHPSAFDSTFTAGIAAAEHSGTITAVFERLTYLLRSDIRLRSTVWSMLMYPLVLCGITVGVLNAMIFFVLPQFAKVFAEIGKEPPPLTRLLLGTGAWAGDHIWYIIALGAVIVFTVFGMRSNARLRLAWDWFALHAVVVRNATRTLSTGRLFRLLGTMLQSGVPLIDGIRLCRESIANRYFRAMFDQVERQVLQGQGVASALQATPFLPIGAANMVATAERSGRLGQVLQTVGEYYEDEGERYLRDVIKILEPAIILALGAVVACVVLSIVLPLLDVTTISH